MHYDTILQLKSTAAEGLTSGSVFAQLTQKLMKTTKTGKPYMELTFADATDNVVIKVWDNAPWNAACRALNEGEALQVTADWQCTAYGIEASQMDFRPLNPAEEEILLSGGAELTARHEVDWQSILAFIEEMRDPRLAALCRSLVEAHEVRFRRAAAARGMHHARRGGLVEHTAGVMKAAAAICSAYPHVNRDLVMAGALFHDCGKMWETGCPEQGFGVEYNEIGELMGHISIGIEVVNSLWKNICTAEQRAEWKPLQPATEQVRLHLLHLIASHHGVLEFGSPVVPKTPEALVLHHADNIDAKMEMFRSAYETSAALSPTIRERKFGLGGNAVLPLASFNVGE
ncbi:MAG: HD domain-containing protein [Akkermansia sp.]|nr:HD domain-containing protein [Akkermansia sp.]